MQRTGDVSGEALQHGKVVIETLCQLHLYGHGIVALLGMERDEVVAAQFLKLHEHLLNL